RVAHEVHAAALPGRLEHLGCRGLDAFVAVADHEFHATQAAPVQAAQELGHERLGFAGADLQAQHFALTFGVHAYSDYYGHAHDTPGLARLHVRGVDPQVRPVALDLAVQERANTLVEFAAQAADLALGDAAHPQRLDQVVHRARGDAVHVGFLDHGGERLLGRAPRLQELGEVAALAQLGDLQLDAAGTRVPRALAVAVAAVDPLGALLVIAGAATPFDIELHEALGHELHHLAQHVDVGSLLGEFGQCHSGGGHRGNLLGQVGGSHLNHIRDHDGHPDRHSYRRAASRFGLRPTRLAATKDLHHFLGHQPARVMMPLLMAHGSWLMAHGSWLMAHRLRRRRERFAVVLLHVSETVGHFCRFCVGVLGPISVR